MNSHATPQKSQSTRGRSDLGSVCVDASKEDCISFGQRVHCGQCDIEPSPGMINREHIDAGAIEGEFPARPTVGRVEAGDRSCASDSRERWKGVEGRET